MPADPAAQAAFVRRFAARQARRAAMGLGASVLVLPLALSAASAAAPEFVYAKTLPKVADVTMNPDGSATLSLEGGQTLTIAAQDVRMLPDGNIAVAAAAVPDLMLVPGAETFLMIALGGVAGALASVGGGGDSQTAPPGSEGGIVVDGYIVGAQVFRDIDLDGVLDPTEPSAITGAGGVFDLAFTDDPASRTAPIVSIGGFDSVTGAQITGTWSAPAGAATVSPLSTVVQALIDLGQSPEAAKTTVRDWFGISGDPLAADPVTQADAGDVTMLKAAAQVQAVISNTVAVAWNAAGGTLAPADETALSKAAAAKVVSQLLDDPTALTQPAKIAEVISETVAGVDPAVAADAGQSVATLNSAVSAITIGADDVTGAINAAVKSIETFQTVAQKTLVDKLAAGDPDVGSFAQGIVDGTILPKQPYRPILTDKRAELGDGTSFAVSGQGTAGSTVSITFLGDDGTLGTASALVDANGTWSTTLSVDPPIGAGLYTVRLGATHPDFADISATRATPFIIGDVADFDTVTAAPGSDYFFYVTDLSVLETDTSVSVENSTISLLLPADASESIRYAYTATGADFSAGLAALPEGTRLLIDGTTLRDLSTDDVEVRVIKYAWPSDWNDTAPSGPTQTSVVLTIFNRATGLDYIGQLGLQDSGLSAIPVFATRSEAETWIRVATAETMPLGTSLSPGTDIPLAGINEFLQAIGRDQTDWTSFVGTALPGSSISLTVGGEAFGPTVHAVADGRWVIAGQDTEAAPVDFDQVRALRVTDPTNRVDLYQIGVDSTSDVFAMEAGARNVLIGLETVDTIDLTRLGYTQAHLDALKEGDTGAFNIAVLGEAAVASVVIGVETENPIFLIGYDDINLTDLQFDVVQANT